MNAAIQRARAARRAAVDAAAAVMRDRGTCWRTWAADNGLDYQSVRDVLRGKPATRGERHRAADAIIQEAPVAAMTAQAACLAPRGALAPVADLLQEILDDELEDLSEYGSSAAVVYTRAWDRAEALDRCARIDRALKLARVHEGSREDHGHA